MEKPSDSAEHFNTKANSNLQIPVKGNLSSKVKSSAKIDSATNSTPGSVVRDKSHSSNPNLGTVVKVLENSRSNVDKVPVEKTSLVGSKLQQEADEFGKKLEELPVDGKRARTQNSSISGQNVPVNAQSTLTTAKRTQVIAGQLVGASKIIKTIPTKRTVSKQVGLAKRVIKQEQMAKRPNGQQFSNTLGQAKPEFSGMEAALKGGDMMLAQEAEQNGNSQKQNLFFWDRSASHQPTEKSIQNFCQELIYLFHILCFLLPQIVDIDSLAAFESIGITSQGRGYLAPPKLLVFDGKTKKQVSGVDIGYKLGDLQVTIFKNPTGMSRAYSPTILPVAVSYTHLTLPTICSV